MDLLNLTILIIACTYTYIQNEYFGHNWSPQSDAEVLADGVSCMLFALAFITV